MKHWSVPYEVFSVLWDNKLFIANSWYSPLRHNIFRYPSFLWNTEGFFYEKIRSCETKRFWQKIVIPATSLIPNLFQYQKFSETQKGSSTNFFGTVRLKNFDRKSWDNRLERKIFRYPKLLTLWRVPQRNVSVLWDETISTENRNSYPFLLSLFFPIPQFNETLKDSHTKIFGTVAQKNFDGRFWYILVPPPSWP